jgi:hypothetical protein
MIFPNLELEPIVQVNDRTRLNSLKSFVTQDESAISLIQIRPTASEDFINVTTDQYLDWQYSASGTHVVTARVTASGASAQVSGSISVITVASDKLFSTDADLRLHESDILKWVEAGRNSFLNIHRRAQKLILEQLRREGYTDVDGAPYTKAAVVDVEEVKQWATMWTLQLIFEALSNATDDVFHEKAVRYSTLRQQWEGSALLRLDTDGDGTVDVDEGIDTDTAFVARR